MDVATLLKNLEGERDALTATINTLRTRLGGSQSHAKAPGAPKAGVKRHGRTWTPAMRAAMSRRLKQVIAAKRAKKAARKPKVKVAAKASA